jgi:signal peptidase I
MPVRSAGGTEQAEAAARPSAHTRWGTAAIAAVSLVFPGVGHLAVGAASRGAAAWLVSRALGFIALGAVVLWPGRLGLAIYAIALIVIALGVARDAVVAARRRDQAHNGRPWYTGFMALTAAAVVVTGASLGWTVFVDSRVADRVRVRTDTMAPTILAGDRMFASPRLGGGVRRGDIIVYKRWETRYVKRVLAVPGDTIAMRAGQVSVDGRAVTEPYAFHGDEGETADRRFAWQRAYLVARDTAYAPTLATWGPLVVPNESYFVLGDDRGESIDSRYSGFLADTAVLGRPLTVYFSRDPAGGAIRWRRVGMAIRAGY